MSRRRSAQETEPDGHDSNGGSAQFDRFEQLTRRLLTVPKQEADKERAKKDQKKNR